MPPPPGEGWARRLGARRSEGSQAQPQLLTSHPRDGPIHEMLPMGEMGVYSSRRPRHRASTRTEKMSEQTKHNKELWLLQKEIIINQDSLQYYQIPNQILSEPFSLQEGSLSPLVETPRSTQHDGKCYPKFENGSRDTFPKDSFEKEKQILPDMLGKLIHRETISNSIPFKGRQSLGPNGLNPKHRQRPSNTVVNPSHNPERRDRPATSTCKASKHPPYTPTGNAINETMGCFRLMHS